MKPLPSWAGWSALLAVATAHSLALAQEALEVSDVPAESAPAQGRAGARAQ